MVTSAYVVTRNVFDYSAHALIVSGLTATVNIQRINYTHHCIVILCIRTLVGGRTPTRPRVFAYQMQRSESPTTYSRGDDCPTTASIACSFAQLDHQFSFYFFNGPRVAFTKFKMEQGD